MTLQFVSIGLVQTGCCKDWFQPVSTDEQQARRCNSHSKKVLEVRVQRAVPVWQAR
jgi:hypothetical protein